MAFLYTYERSTLCDCMDVTIEIPKRSSKFQQQILVHVGVVALYAIAFTIILSIAAIIASSERNWGLYAWLGSGFFIFFYFISVFELGIFSVHRAWGKYTVNTIGIVVEKETRSTTYQWGKFVKYDISPLTTLKTDLNFNERLFPKIVRLQRLENMHVVQLYIQSKNFPFIEFPVRDSDLPTVKEMLNTYLHVH